MWKKWTRSLMTRFQPGEPIEIKYGRKIEGYQLEKPTRALQW